ncbi:MAG: hypothetical protein IK999_06895 [Ruminococcus sp.]|nr:hypothetical protein [Ruminococcus sp.]
MTPLGKLMMLLVVVMIFVLGTVIIGVLEKGVRSGSISPAVMAATVTAFLILVFGGLIAFIAVKMRQFREHKRESSSADILNEIMAMKDTDKKEDEP